MSEIQNNTFTCPQCGEDGPLQMWTSINVAHDPDARRRIEDLSVFEWTCPNCKKTALVLHPCLYHDPANEFMVWFAPDGEVAEDTRDFSQLNDYTLRTTKTPNEFREKINIGADQAHPHHAAVPRQCGRRRRRIPQHRYFRPLCICSRTSGRRRAVSASSAGDISKVRQRCARLSVYTGARFPDH